MSVGIRKVSRLAFLVVAMLLGSQRASAELVYDVYLIPSGPYAGPETKAATFDPASNPLHPGDVLTFKVYIKVTDSDGNPTNEGVKAFHYSLKSNAGSAAVRGSLGNPAMITTDFPEVIAPDVADLNADAYSDLGGHLPSSATGWAFSRSPSGVIYNTGDGVPSHPAMTFELTIGMNSAGVLDPDPANSLFPGGPSLTINAYQRVYASGATWIQDGVSETGLSPLIAGSPVTITYVVAEPASLALLALGGLGIASRGRRR